MASAKERYDKAVDKLRGAATARLRYERKQYDAAMRESRQRQRRYEQMLEEASKGPGKGERVVGGITGALTGAGMGMMATGSPFGAIAGAGIGGTSGALAPRQTPQMLAAGMPLAAAAQSQRMSLQPKPQPGPQASPWGPPMPNEVYRRMRPTTGAQFRPSISVPVPQPTLPTVSAYTVTPGLGAQPPLFAIPPRKG